MKSNRFKNLFFLSLFAAFFTACEKFGSDANFDAAIRSTSGSEAINSSNGVPKPDTTNKKIVENPFFSTSEAPVTTFSIDADGASYTLIRRLIQQSGTLPFGGDVIRTEELINYFDINYNYTPSEHPLSMNGELSTCPWKTGHHLLRIGIKGQPKNVEQLPSSNFVLLIDVSGSMSSDDKLNLLKKGFNIFVDQMRPQDRVAIVTYAGSVGVALESTAGTEKQKIKNAINGLGSGGSTAGGAGITMAYEIAKKNFVKGGNNRIILGTDGDFNVGISSAEELVKLIETKRDEGVFLSVLGVGAVNDYGMERLANNGNGTYEYLDKVEELQKVFIQDFSKFYAAAKDVKIQVEFDANQVSAYRLIGYENRLLENEDFEDDKKDAGELGINQNITALYEVVLKNNGSNSNPLCKVNLRYKAPESDVSIPMSLDIFDKGATFENASPQMIFTSSVASFGLLLNNSNYKGTANYDAINGWLDKTTSLPDKHGLNKEFKELVMKAKSLQR